MTFIPIARVDALTEQVIGCAIAVHREHGPGLLESIYGECMVIELQAAGLLVETHRRVQLTYKGHRLATHLVIDMVVERSVLVELKAVERVHPVHLAQVITYLKLTGCPVGLLMNFNSVSLRAGLRRLVHPDLYVKRQPQPRAEAPVSSSAPAEDPAGSNVQEAKRSGDIRSGVEEAGQCEE